MKKKYLMTIILLGLLLTTLSANSPTPLRNLFVHEEFATYHDQRGTMNILRAYWVLTTEDNTLFFFIRNIDMETKEEKNYIVEISEDEKGAPKIVQLIGVEKSDDPKFTQSYVDLLNFINIRRLNPQSFKKKGIVKDKWENYTQLFKVNPLYPLFQFSEISIQSDKKIQYKILTAGKIKFENRELFEKMKPFPDLTFKTMKEYTLDTQETTARNLGDYTVELDERWKHNSESGFPGFWLPGNSYRDSQISMEKTSENFLKKCGIPDIPSFIRIIMYADDNFIVILDSLDIKSGRNTYEVSYTLYNQQMERTRYKLKLWRKKDSLYILNFSSHLGVFRDNQNYFKAILKSVKINK